MSTCFFRHYQNGAFSQLGHKSEYEYKYSGVCVLRGGVNALGVGIAAAGLR